MDPQQQQQIGNMMAGFIGIAIFIGLIFVAFLVFLFWRIFTKAGMAGALSLLVLIWPIGLIIVLCVLAFGDWKVVPVQLAAPYYPPAYPPPPPPASFQPPPAPPTQL